MMKTVLQTIGLLLLLLSTAGCNNTSSSPLRIAHNSWPGYEPLVLAESESLYKDINVTTFRVGSATEAIRAFEQNIVDVVAITLDEALLLQRHYPEPLVVIAVLDISHGGDAIIAKQGINSISDLKGKRVGFEATAMGAFFLSRALETSPGLSLEELKIIPITYNHHHNSFISNEVDAIVTFEPVKTALVRQGGNVIFDSSMIPNEIVDVLITNNTRSEQRSVDLQNLVRGYFKALSLIKKHPDMMQEKMAAFEGIDTAEFQRSLSGLKIPDATMNHQLLGGKSPQLQTTINKLQQFIATEMNAPNGVGTTLILSDKFIPVENNVK